MTLKIWGRISSINVRKVVLTAQWLGLPFERIDAGMAFGVVNTPEFLRLNPNAMIPVIEDDGYVLWESNVIVRYLCAKHSFGSCALYPQDIRASFDAERWMDWQQTTLNRASGPAFVQWIRTAPEQRNLQVIAQSVAATEPLLAILDAQLSHRAFVAGEAMTMADFPIACEIHRWWGLPQPRPAYPHIERWYAHFTQHDASRGVLDLPLS
jgi:glutathione S-transferase